MKLEPYGSRIIVKQFEDEMQGRIIIPDEAKKASLRAIVVENGEDCEWVKKGDTIIVGRYAKFALPLRGQEYLDMFVMNEDDILARIEGE